jgi:hypothetical protein
LELTIDILLLISNAIITWICGGVILYKVILKQLERHPFYYAWILGFFLYGMQLIFRAYAVPDFIQVVPLFFSFLFFVFGIWTLSRKKKFIYIIATIYFVLFVNIWYLLSSNIQTTNSLIIGGTLTYLPVAVGVLYHRYIFGRNVDKLALGWFLLYFSNILLWGMGWIIDAFAIISKIIIFLGIIDYEFIITTEKIRREWLTRRPPIHTWPEKEGLLKLVQFNSYSDRSKEIDWIMREIQEKIKNDEYIYVFSFQDTIPHGELRRIKWIFPKKVFIFLFSTSTERAKKEFTILPFGLTQIGATLSEVIKKHEDSSRHCTVFFTDLSLLIHVLGTYPCYNLLLNKMGSLREAGVELVALFHSKTHNDRSVVSLFESIADEVIRL